MKQSRIKSKIKQERKVFKEKVKLHYALAIATRQRPIIFHLRFLSSSVAKLPIDERIGEAERRATMRRVLFAYSIGDVTDLVNESSQR